MANNLDINKAIGDVAALNAEIQKTVIATGQLVKNQTELNKLIGKSKGVTDLNEKQTKAKQTQNQVEQQGNKLLSQRNTLIAKQASKLAPLRQSTIKQSEALKEQNRLMREQAKIDLGIKKRNGLFRSMTKSMIAMGVAMIGIRTVFNLFKNSLRTIATFEEAMSKVRAVAGATANQFKLLVNNAKELGSSTSKTAREVAGLQLEFSKLGFSTKEILAATEATISLSIAAGSDLAESAVVAASTIRGFGLNANETQRIVDVMAKSFASSALDLEKFKVSMAIAAPISKAFGKDIEFTTARLSVLADAGLDASTSGTSLRNIFLELSKRGLTWDQGLAKINSSTDKGVTALDLFGKRGATAALILADNIEKANGLEEAYDKAAGSAAAMAKIMEDNLIGDTKRLSSAWEGFILGLNKGEGTISIVFRGLVQWLTKVVNGFNMANKSYKELVDLAQEDTLKKALENDEKELDKLAAIYAKTRGETEAYNKAIDDLINQLRVTWTAEGDVNKIIRARIFALKALKKETIEVTKTEFERFSNLSKIENEHLKREAAITAFIKEQLKERLGDQKEYTVGLSDELIRRNEKEMQHLRDVAEAELTADELKKEIRDQAISAAQETGNILFDLAQSQRDRELESLGAEYDAKIAAAEGNAELQERLANELKDKQDKLKAEQAQSEKNQALFNIAINTATGIVKTISNVGFPLAIPLLAIQAAIGAVQLAAVASQPIPEFFKGTESAPAGLAWIAERGPELLNSPDGSSMLVNEPSIMNLQKGTQVKTAEQTQDILNKAIYNDIAINGNQGVESRLDSLIHTLRNQPKEVTVFDDGGIQRYLQTGNSKTHYLNRKGRK